MLILIFCFVKGLLEWYSRKTIFPACLYSSQCTGLLPSWNIHHCVPVCHFQSPCRWVNTWHFAAEIPRRLSLRITTREIIVCGWLHSVVTRQRQLNLSKGKISTNQIFLWLFPENNVKCIFNNCHNFMPPWMAEFYENMSAAIPSKRLL